MAELMFPDIAGSFMRGQQFGTQQRQEREQEQRRSGLASLAQQAYTADPSQRDALIGQAYGIDADGGAGLSKALGSEDERRAKQLVGRARWLKALPEAQRAQAYAAMVPDLQRMGIQAPAVYDPTVMQAIDSLASVADGSTPAGLREFEGMTQGLAPDDREKARRIALGLDARQSSAAYGYQKLTGPDGREYLVATDPRGIGAQTIGGGPAFGSLAPSAPNGSVQSGSVDTGSGPQPIAAGGQSVDALIQAEQQRAAAAGEPPLTPREIAGLRMAYQEANSAPATAPQAAPTPQPQGGALPPPLDYQGGGAANPFASRLPEDAAAAKTAAEERAKLDFLPERSRLETEAAIERERGVGQAKADIEKAAAAPALIATLQTSIDSIDELLASPDLGRIVGLGSANPLNMIPGSPARGLIARAEQISGQAFLAAFNQLKGGGAITEREGEAATKAMGRLDRSQSLADYKAALTDLKNALMPAIERQRAALSGAQGNAPSGSVLRWNPATGDFE